MIIVLELKTVNSSLHSWMIFFFFLPLPFFSDWQPPEWQKHVVRLQLFCHCGSLWKWLSVRGSAFFYMTCWKMKGLLCLSSNRPTEWGRDDERCQQTVLYHVPHPLTNKQLTDVIQCTTRQDSPATTAIFAVSKPSVPSSSLQAFVV